MCNSRLMPAPFTGCIDAGRNPPVPALFSVEASMSIKKLLGVMTFTFIVGFSPWLAAQVQTPAPPGGSRRASGDSRTHQSSQRIAGRKSGRRKRGSRCNCLPAAKLCETARRRYPVVYALHGYFIGADQWTHEIHVPQTLEGAFALGASEMIVVCRTQKPPTTDRCIQAP